MPVSEFDSASFGAEQRIAAMGGAAGEETELLEKVRAGVAASPLGEEFDEVRVDVPLTVSLAGAAPPEALAPALDKMPFPLRVVGAGREIFLPNDAPEPHARLAALASAVEACRAAPGPAEPVIVQQLAGRARSGRFYPNVSGALLGENCYPVSYMKPAEGVATATLGIGTGKRLSLRSLRFSPHYPELMPDFSMPADIVKNSQREFYAVDLSGGAEDGSPGASAAFELQAALDDGTLAPVGGVYSAENQMVYPGVHREGIKVVTFASLLKGNIFPFTALLVRLHELLAAELPEPVTIRYSVNLKSLREKAEVSEFFIEHAAPQRAPLGGDALDLADMEEVSHRAICSSNAALGDGTFDGVRDIVAVCPDRLDIARSREIADEVGRFNERLAGEGRPYILIGSGRWGTTDKYLGIPVAWHQVAGARIQVEAGLEGFNIESSRGTHFFRELTFHETGAMHVTLQRPGDAADWEWLQSAPAREEGRFVRLLTFEEPLRIRIDGRTGRGAVLKPGG